MSAIIKKIKSIKCFGAFKDFEWKNVKENDGQEIQLKPINFIFGRNYSGKTTLSKIIQSLERKELPAHYDGAAFEVEMYDGTVLDQTQVAASPTPVRVFNRDFVSDNLAFLRDTRSDEKIKPFAILGDGSRDAAKRIDAILEELGQNEEDRLSGRYKVEAELKAELALKVDDLNKAERDLLKIKQKIATDKDVGIKYNFREFGEQNYTVGHLEKDLNTVRDGDFRDITADELSRLKTLIGETSQPNINPGSIFRFSLEGCLTKVKELLERRVVAGEKIAELVNDLAKESWVRKGFELHKDNHATCSFCGQTITEKRWDDLGKHFSGEAETLRNDILNAIQSIQNRRNILLVPKISDLPFYSKFKEEARALSYEEYQCMELHADTCDALISLLRKRERSLATPLDAVLPEDPSGKFNDFFARVSDLVKRNNDYTAKLADEQKKARNMLRLHRVVEAAREFKLDSFEARRDLKKDVKEECSGKLEMTQSRITKLKEMLREARRMLNDESEAADLINKYLSWMGDTPQTLQLVPEAINEDGIETKVFRIMRAGRPAYNLSEGECNLVAFCYFLATLSAPELQNDKPIVWIDDPISSLDSNHIYFVYAMIRSVIVVKKCYSQLFIATHNLEFFRYLSKVQDWKLNNNGKEVLVETSWLFVHRRENGSVIERLPNYLKRYVTEFAYLFAQIYNAAEADPMDANYEKLIYGFGNAARRFLEIYLYFKFPNDNADEKGEHTKRMLEIFDDHVRAFMIDRVINELSHEPGAFGRSMQPLDSSEVHAVALEILRGIKEEDPRQYEHLLKGIGKADIL